MKVLVTGGAGYIGSTVASALLDRGITPVILDNLVTGRLSFTEGREFYYGCISEGPLIDQIFREHPEIVATIHCAGLIVVPDSIVRPTLYYQENVAKSIALIGHLRRNGSHRIIFSSSAACYRGDVDQGVDERSPTAPSSPYAQTKTMVEEVLADAALAGELQALSLRYFNPIGADPAMRTGQQNPHSTHVLGNLIRAWEGVERFTLTGVDLATRDGSAVRDYVHVWDLAEAHVAALQRFDDVMRVSLHGYKVINLGSGRGTTVRELIAAFEKVTGVRLRYEEAPPRPGDTPGSFSRNELAGQLLGWQPRLSLEDGIRHALRWRALDAEDTVGARR